MFVRSVIIDAPIERVFAFHERSDALKLLTPAFPPVRVVHQSGGIRNGARVELRVGFLRWLALHSGYELNRQFIDEQIEGPFRSWVHRHEFEDVGGRTRLTDRVEYLLPGGPLVERLLSYLVGPMLGRMFRHRHRITKQNCERAGGKTCPATERSTASGPSSLSPR